VKFFSPNCGHCVRLAPTWKSLAENISEHVTIGSVNCQVSQDLCGRYQIQGVPSLKMFTRSDKDDKLMVLDYNEERNLEQLIAYAKRHAVSYLYTIDANIPTALNKRHVTIDEFLSKVS
jgi:thioredoxin-like negative regulator of GroEL